MTSSPRRLGPVKPVLAGNLTLGLTLFLGGFVAFLAFTLPMDNQFAEYVKANEPFMALEAQLRILPAYVILALGFTFLSWPLLARLRLFREVGEGSRVWWFVKRLAMVVVVDGLIWVLSLGASTTWNPATVDSLARQFSPTMPNADWMALHESPIIPILTGGFVALVLFAIWSWWQHLGGIRGSLLVGAPLLTCAGLLILPQLRSEIVPPATSARWNVLMVGSDSLRADHLGCYGYERNTSPNIDTLAKRALMFDQMTVSTASTLESWGTFLSSKYPGGHGLRYMFVDGDTARAFSANEDLLTKVLKRQGYHTFVSSNWAGNCFKLVDMGFEANEASDVQNLDAFIADAAIMAHPIFPMYFTNKLGEALWPRIRQATCYLAPHTLLDRAEDEIQVAREQDKPFFGVLFTATTHIPYQAHYPFNVKWIDKNYRGPNRYQIDFNADDFMANGFPDQVPQDEKQHIINLYDGTVSEFDQVVADTLEMLKRNGVSGNTLVIVMSDHGDDLYEKDASLGHGTNFFGGDQTTRIPFLMAFPDGRGAGRVVKQVTRTLDFAPTLLNILDIDVPDSYAGADLAPAMADPEQPMDLPAFAETCYLFFSKQHHPEDALTVEGANHTLMIDSGFRNNLVLREKFHEGVINTKDRMVRTNRWKLIHIPGKNGPIYQLYDMKADPGQLHDLTPERPEVMERLIRMLDAWWAGETDMRWSAEDDG